MMHLVGVVERARIAVRGREVHDDAVARVHRAAVDLGRPRSTMRAIVTGE